MTLHACDRCGSVRRDSSQCSVCGGESFETVERPSEETTTSTSTSTTGSGSSTASSTIDTTSSPTVDVTVDDSDDEEPDHSLTDLANVGEQMAEAVADEGYETVDDVAAADPEDLEAVDGLGSQRATETHESAVDLVEEE